MDNKYQNAKIYKIVDNTNGNIYIGSTCKPLKERMWDHKADYKRFLNNKFNYITSFKILENNDYDIVLIENIENCSSKEDMYKKERFYIENLDCINKRKPIATKEENLQQKREYHQANKEVLNRNKKVYRQINKEKIQKKEKTITFCKVCLCNHIKKQTLRHQRTLKHKQNLHDLLNKMFYMVRNIHKYVEQNAKKKLQLFL